MRDLSHADVGIGEHRLRNRRVILPLAGTRNRRRSPRRGGGRASAELDQPANPSPQNPSLKSKTGCLKIVDTHRRAGQGAQPNRFHWQSAALRRRN
jgi:hypothetical protein